MNFWGSNNPHLDAPRIGIIPFGWCVLQLVFFQLRKNSTTNQPGRRCLWLCRPRRACGVRCSTTDGCIAFSFTAEDSGSVGAAVVGVCEVLGVGADLSVWRPFYTMRCRTHNINNWPRYETWSYNAKLLYRIIKHWNISIRQAYSLPRNISTLAGYNIMDDILSKFMTFVNTLKSSENNCVKSMYNNYVFNGSAKYHINE